MESVKSPIPILGCKTHFLKDLNEPYKIVWCIDCNDGFDAAPGGVPIKVLGKEMYLKMCLPSKRWKIDEKCSSYNIPTSKS